LTARVTSTAGTPTGNVQFLDGTTASGTTALNAQGIATDTLTLTAGSHSIEAMYVGDSDFAGSQAMLTQVIATPGLSLSSTPSALTLAAGQTGAFKISVTPSGGYTGSITFTCAGLPTFVSCSFSPATLTVDGSNTATGTTLQITTSGSSSGLVSALGSNPFDAGTHTLLFGWLPGGLAAFVLFRKRKKLPNVLRIALWIAILATSVMGIEACGGGGAMNSTPPGNSTIIITATGLGGIAQSLPISVTVTR
jgi:hypothetical protein